MKIKLNKKGAINYSFDFTAEDLQCLLSYLFPFPHRKGEKSTLVGITKEALDPYRTLGLPANSTLDDVKTRYRQLANIYHPDKKLGNEEKMKHINIAYEAITGGSR